MEFVVFGYFQHTFGGMARMPWPEPLKSESVEAENEAAAINLIFGRMQAEFAVMQEAFDKFDSSDEGDDEELTRITLAMEPINRENWEAILASDKTRIQTTETKLKAALPVWP